MTTSTVRMYGSEKNARDAATRLKEAGFAEESIVLVTPASGKTGDDVANAVKAGNLLGHAASFYAERVRDGRSLVVVRAPFGRGQAAKEILDACSPVDTDLAPPAAPEAEWGRGAPFSRAAGMRVLLRDSPAPMSQALGIPTLSRGLSFLYSFFGELTKHDYSLSGGLGMRLLSDNPAPLSSMFGMSTISTPRGEWTHSCGLPLLSGKAPFSSLSDNPAPLSSALGLPLLTGKR